MVNTGGRGQNKNNFFENLISAKYSAFVVQSKKKLRYFLVILCKKCLCKLPINFVYSISFLKRKFRNKVYVIKKRTNLKNKLEAKIKVVIV